MTRQSTKDFFQEYFQVTSQSNMNQWTNMPAISDELYRELVKEFNNERHYFFNDSYILED